MRRILGAGSTTSCFADTAILLWHVHTRSFSELYQPPIKNVQNLKRDEVIPLQYLARVIQTLANEIRFDKNFTGNGRSERSKDRYILFYKINSMFIYIA